MKLALPVSTLVKEANYNEKTQDLIVELNCGAVYAYKNIPANLIKLFEDCAQLPKGSVGSLYNGLIKMQGYQCKRLK